MTNLCVLKPAVARRHLSVAPLLGILLAAANDIDFKKPRDPRLRVHRFVIPRCISCR